ncbi:Uncharacterized protein ToN1_26180 [Aromatoleum petrolei]|nr:Uncharacterized protein ToN1_26180 [Aromatoleum petrolei]
MLRAVADVGRKTLSAYLATFPRAAPPHRPPEITAADNIRASNLGPKAASPAARRTPTPLTFPMSSIGCARSRWLAVAH